MNRRLDHAQSRCLKRDSFGLFALLLSVAHLGGCASGSQGDIRGEVSGHVVQRVAAAYFIGKSDDPQHTIVAYVFDAPVACSDLGSAGWDTRVADATGALEMKLIGTAPGTYPVASSPNPGQGQAAVNFTVTSSSATPTERSSTSGSVQLDVVEDMQLAAGSFHLVFSQGALDGTFSATWCADGHEP